VDPVALLQDDVLWEFGGVLEASPFVKARASRYFSKSLGQNTNSAFMGVLM
jgi:hypothetical protein